jgi:hypothetical protein
MNYSKTRVMACALIMMALPNAFIAMEKEIKKAKREASLSELDAEIAKIKEGIRALELVIRKETQMLSYLEARGGSLEKFLEREVKIKTAKKEKSELEETLRLLQQRQLEEQEAPFRLLQQRQSIEAKRIYDWQKAHPEMEGLEYLKKFQREQ